MYDSNLQARMENYLAKMPPAISGKGGHKALFDAAIALVQGFAMDVEQAVDFLWTHYNPRCQPRWTEKEIRHKCEDALNKSRSGEELGYLLRGREDWSPKTRRRVEVSVPVAAGAFGKKKLVEEIIYPYVDEMGGNHHLIRRLKYSDGQKMFFPYHWDGERFTSGFGELPRVPMNAPEVKKASYVWLTEGEKCACEWLRLLKERGEINPDVAVTCFHGGVGGWKPELTPHFHGKKVCILPDNDGAGEKFVRKVAWELEGVAESVLVKNWPEGTPEKWDVADAIQNMEGVK